MPREFWRGWIVSPEAFGRTGPTRQKSRRARPRASARFLDGLADALWRAGVTRGYGFGLKFLAVCTMLNFSFMGALFAEPIHFSNTDRVLVIAPHPDDETLGAGGVIQSALEAKAQVKVMYLTNGDQNEIASIFYQKKPLLVTEDFLKSGQWRRNEATQAMAELGLGKSDLIFLGYPDFGTLTIWRGFWGHVKPYRSFFTRLHKVMYQDDFASGSYFIGDNIVANVQEVMHVFQPTVIFVTPPFDLNPDHRAAYLYLNVALLNLGPADPPKIYAYLVHARQWPKPRGRQPDRPLEPPDKVAWSHELQWISFDLSGSQVEKKKKVLMKYASQAAYSRDFLLSFTRANELFAEVPYEKLSGCGDRDPDTERGAASPEVEYRVCGEKLRIQVLLSSYLEESGGLEIEMFPYKRGVPFALMPKLDLTLSGDRLFLKENKKNVYGVGVDYQIQKKKIWIDVPISLLKDPDHLFACVHASSEELSLDFGSWRIFEIEKALKNGQRAASGL